MISIDRQSKDIYINYTKDRNYLAYRNTKAEELENCQYLMLFPALIVLYHSILHPERTTSTEKR